MKAIVIKNGSAVYAQIDTPIELAANEVLVKVAFAGLCGSDMQAMLNGDSSNILGHELSGIVEIVGAGVSNIFPRDAVSVMPLFFGESIHSYPYTISGSLGKTKNGGFSEFVIVPAHNLFKLSSRASLKEAALIDVLACAVHCYNLLGRPTNKKIAIVGDGAIGLTCLNLFLFFSNEITVFGKHQASLVTQLGAEFIASEEDALADRFDYVVEAIGRNQSASIAKSILLVKPRGKIVFEGVFPRDYKADIEIRRAFYKECILQGANSYEPSEFEEATQLIESGSISLRQLITHILPLSQFEKGVELMKNKASSKAIKILFDVCGNETG